MWRGNIALWRRNPPSPDDAVPPVSLVPRKSRRFALLYAVAWLPYLAVYSSAMVFSGEASFQVAALAGAAQALPSGLLGLIVLRVCRRLVWDPDRRMRFFLSHVGVGLSYAAIASA